MKVRRVSAAFALATMAILGTAGIAAAGDYPPTTGSVITEAASVTSSTAPSSTAAGQSTNSAGLPFTGGNSVELIWIGAACAGAGALAVARTRRHRKHV